MLGCPCTASGSCDWRRCVNSYAFGFFKSHSLFTSIIIICHEYHSPSPRGSQFRLLRSLELRLSQHSLHQLSKYPCRLFGSICSLLQPQHNMALHPRQLGDMLLESSFVKSQLCLTSSAVRLVFLKPYCKSYKQCCSVFLLLERMTEPRIAGIVMRST